MSRMVKGSIARAGSATASVQKRSMRANNSGKRIKGSAGEQSIDVVVEREERESEQECQAESLSDLHGPLGDGTSLRDFGEIIHQVPSVQQGNRQQVEHAEADAHEREEAEVGDPAELR